MSAKSLFLRASGPLACFGRCEFKAERVSYPVMTPSAARGIFEAILWKPAISWRIRTISVLAPIRWTAFRRNEVNSRAASPSAALVDRGGVAPMLLVEDDRAQRNTVALRDVDYLIEADIELTDRLGPGENRTKFVEMFQRRLEKGQHFHQPYLGCREFIAEVSPPSASDPRPIDESSDLGLMLYDIEFRPDGNRPLFFHANLEHGVLHVPSADALAGATT